MGKRLNDFFHSKILLQENIPSQGIETVQLLRTGSFKHSQAPNGMLVISKEALLRMKLNFDNNARRLGTKEIAVDYGHESEKEAAGWIKAVELRNEGNELWINVDWTPDAARAITDKKWRMISADLDLNYQDNELNVSHGPTLLGAGLTNRPHVKAMNPILSEENNINKKGFPMEETVKELMSKIAALESKLAALESQLGVKKEEVLKKDGEMGEMKKELGEKEKQLSEVKAKLADAEGKIVLAEKEKVFTALLSEGKIIPAQKDAFMKMDVKLAEELFGKATPVLNLSEKGNNGKGGETKVLSVEEEIDNAAKKLSEERKVNLADAYSIVLSENLELSKRYDEHVSKVTPNIVNE